MSCCEIYLLVFTNLGHAHARTLLAPPTDLSSGLGKEQEEEKRGTTAKRAPRARADTHCSHRVMFYTVHSGLKLATRE